MARALTKATRQRARAAFLAELAQRGNVSAACAAAALSRAWFYEHRAADPVFAAAWDAALETAIDAMELEARRRAVEGVEKPLIGRIGKDQDGIITVVREYSDSLMALLLKAHRPDKYRERQEVQHTGKVEIEYTNDWRAPDAD
jgi:hypothetical protein